MQLIVFQNINFDINNLILSFIFIISSQQQLGN